ncbi:Beta-galactosidase BgaA [compost metagenome]
MNNQAAMLPLPGLLAKCTGIRVEEYDPIGLDSHRVVNAAGHSFMGSQWCDIISLEGAEAIAWYDEDFYSGVPAVTVNSFGQGRVYYLGTHPEEAYLQELFTKEAKAHGIQMFPGLPEGVQVALRSGESASYLFVMNLSRQPHQITLPASCHSVLYDKKRQETLSLEPYGIDILELPALVFE